MEKIKEWYNIAKDWITDRCAERTSLDGAVLIAFGIIAVIFQPIIFWVGLISLLF